jgi:hypothetical protein
MPHTSRRYRKNTNINNGSSSASHGKRIEIIDDDGWTHVANSTSIPTRSSGRKMIINTLDGAADEEDEDLHGQKILPAEAPPHFGLTGLKRQFESHSLAWAQSDTWERLRSALVGILSPNSNITIENIVCIGLGSPSGFVRGGWVDRRSVALYQLSALVSVLKLLHEPQSNKDVINVPIYAQDPVFNALDKDLLLSLGVIVVEDPSAFGLVTRTTFLFCPGAERAHLDLMLLSSSPALVFGGPLEENPSEVLAGFLSTSKSLRMPEFGGNSHAFWNMRLYWRDHPEDSDDRSR